jgi:hypothetical protein
VLPGIDVFVTGRGPECHRLGKDNRAEIITCISGSPRGQCHVAVGE